MTKLDVDPPRLAGAGRSLDSKTDALASAVQALETALSSSGQMCGNDAAGKAFALSYRQGGQALFSAAQAAVNACRNVGYGIEVSASNYAQSEAASRIGGGEPSVQPPSQPSKFSGPTMPNPFGPAVGEPLLWSIVREFVGSPWPDGNPATLRAAAGAWRSFGGAIAGVSGAIGGCSAEVSGHDIPELASIVSAVTQLGSGVGDLEKQCASIASSLDSFAGEVEASQQAIRDLLHQLSLSGVLEELGRIFSGHNPMDDIKRVANDIKVILHTLGREADATSSLFQAVMSELDTLTTQFENWTRKEFTHFLGNKVGNAVADLYNSDVDILEGGTKSLLETVGSLGDLATHPQKLLDLAKQANPEYQIANFVANPKAAFEHNLDVVKGLVDAKDWNSDHPLRGFGDNLGTGLQFLIPGAGEAKAGAEGARAADEAAQAAKTEGKAADGLLGGGLKSDVAGQGSRITHDLDGIKATPAEPAAPKPAEPGAVKPAEPAPAGRPADPAPGRPSDLGASKPAEPGSTVRPADPGAAEPGEPGSTVRATEPATGGGAGAHEPAPVGSTATPAEHAPVGSAGAPAEHAPTAAAPHEPGGSHAEHAAGPPHSAPESHPGGGDAHGGAPHDPGGHGGGGVAGHTGDSGGGSGHPDGHGGSDGSDGHDSGAHGGDRQDPMHSQESSGDGWHRVEDKPHDPSYGEPLEDHWSGGSYPDPQDINPEIRDLIKDPEAPFGRDPDGTPFSQEDYERRYNQLGPNGEPWDRYPPNDGAVRGTRVEYDSAEAFVRDYGSAAEQSVMFDRIGGESGKYLGLVQDGVPAAFESRGLPLSSLGKDYFRYSFSGALPSGWQIEISEIAPAFGRDGGGIQVLVTNEQHVVMTVDELLDKGVLK